MAYQQQGGLTNGPAGSGEHHGPQGTEYTLQGEHSIRGRDALRPTGASWASKGDICKSQTNLATFIKALCAFSRSNGTTTSVLATPGTLSALR